MKWLADFIKKYPVIQSNYEKQVVESVKQELDELKAKVPEHRWWEVDDIDAMEFDLPIEDKDRLRRFELYSEILEIMDHKGIESAELKQILDDLEFVAKTLTDREKKEMEIMLLEGLINRTLSSTKMYDQFYKALGPELRKMCDSNNDFWMGGGEKKPLIT